MTALRFVIALCTATVLCGCAGAPDLEQNNMSWQQHYNQLSHLDHWQVKGKIALRTARQSESGSLVWQQTLNNSHISLSGPLGLGATIIESDASELRVSREGSTRRYDISSPQLAAASTGWDLPLPSLRHWIKGLPSPHSEVQSETIEQGLWRKLEQDGWTITFERYRQFQQYTLPTRLTVERGDTRARLILKTWSDLNSP